MKPILLCAPMVQATLEDRKLLTRRSIKLIDFQRSTTKGYDWEFRNKRAVWNSISHKRLLELCPYGKIGDVLWVRETWKPHGRPDISNTKYIYKADKSETIQQIIKWKPSIFMPLEACRLFLKVTDVRVERLQDISEDDAIAEGIEVVISGLQYHDIYKDYLNKNNHLVPILSYASLWESINSKGSWELNPFVWVISFKKIEKP